VARLICHVIDMKRSFSSFQFYFPACEMISATATRRMSNHAHDLSLA